MNEELKKLYDAIASRGFYTKSYDEFVNQYQDPAYRDKVFDVVTREGLYTKGRNEFDVKYGAAPLKKKRTIRFYFSRGRYGASYGSWFIGIAKIKNR